MLPPQALPNITDSQQYSVPNFTAFFPIYNHIFVLFAYFNAIQATILKALQEQGT